MAVECRRPIVRSTFDRLKNETAITYARCGDPNTQNPKDVTPPMNRNRIFEGKDEEIRVACRLLGCENCPALRRSRQ